MCAYRHACRDWEQTARNVRRRRKEKSTQKREEEKDQKNGAAGPREVKRQQKTRREKTKGERGGTFTGKEEKAIRSSHPEQRETQTQKSPQKTGNRPLPPHIYTHTPSLAASGIF